MSFNYCRLIHFDIAVGAFIKSSGLWVAFNRLGSSEGQPFMGWGAG